MLGLSPVTDLQYGVDAKVLRPAAKLLQLLVIQWYFAGYPYASRSPASESLGL